MSGGLGADFLGELREEGSFLAVTFYTSLGIVLVLVTIIVILSIGFCCLARFMVKRTASVHRKNNGLSVSNEELELDVRNVTKNGSDMLRNNTVKEGGSAELQEVEVVESSKDDTPLIHHEEGSKGPQEKQPTDEELDDNTMEGMYATVNKTSDTETGETTGDTKPPKITAVGDEDYAEVQCQPNPVYNHPLTDTTKPRSHTIDSTATVVLESGNEDYSRLVHITQPNPRLSMPLLSEYARIDLSGVKRNSLGKDLDQDTEMPKSADHEMVNDPPPGDANTPPPLPTPILDDIIELKFGSHAEEYTPPPEVSSSKRMKGCDYETMSDPPKAESPSPLPPPLLEGEDPGNEALYDNAPIILQNSQNLSNSFASNDLVEVGESGALKMESKGDHSDQSNTTECLSSMNTPEGIYENIGKGVG